MAQDEKVVIFLQLEKHKVPVGVPTQKLQSTSLLFMPKKTERLAESKSYHVRLW